MSYLYALPHPGQKQYTKVGITEDLQNRLRGYQTSAPERDYSYAYTWPMASTEDARGVERDVLALAAEACLPVRNEWIRAPASIVASLVEDCLEPIYG